MAKTEKRDVQLESLEDAVSEARSLAESGYSQLGQWDLAQVCGHVAQWIRYPVEGFPTPPLAMRMMMPLMRTFIGKPLGRKILAGKPFPTGAPTMPASVPTSGDLSESDAIDQLDQAVHLIQSHPGKLHPSPFFGEMEKSQVITLHTRHAAHHLGFLKPNRD